MVYIPTIYLDTHRNTRSDRHSYKQTAIETKIHTYTDTDTSRHSHKHSPIERDKEKLNRHTHMITPMLII